MGKIWIKFGQIYMVWARTQKWCSGNELTRATCCMYSFPK